MADHPDPVESRLRDEVERFARECDGRSQPQPRIHVGELAAWRSTVDVPPGTDAGLRRDLLNRLLSAHPLHRGTAVWLTRSGPPTMTDLDLAWWSTTRAGRDAFGVALPFYVITRRSWRMPDEDRTRIWGRLRLGPIDSQ